MKTVWVVLLAVVALGIGWTTPYAQENVKDPYEILNRHINAVGGMERLEAEKTSYSEGRIIIVGTGLEGTFKAWSQSPLRQRQEVDLTILQQTSGDNGRFAWSVDVNGKLQIVQDEPSLKRRQIQELVTEYDFLDPASENFSLTFEGVDTVGEVRCYVVKTANSINDDYSLSYYNRDNFLLEKQVRFTPDSEERVLFSDYREIDGVKHAFRQDIEVMPLGQKQTVELTEYRGNVEIDPALFEPPSQDVEDFRFVNGGSSVRVPFKFIENHIYLLVNIGGKERLWVLDSGAGMSVIDPRFVSELGLTAEGNLKGQGAGNTVQVSFVTIPSYRVGDIEFEAQKVASIDIASLFDRLLGFEVVGILGYDFLSRFVTRVDYAAEELTFYLPDSFAYEGPGKVIDAPLQGNFFSPQATVDGKYAGRWRLDLGAGGESFHYPFAEANDLLDREGVLRMGHGAGGSIMEKSVKFENIEFGGFILPDPIISVPAGEGEGSFSEAELIGNLGNSLFRHFVLYLDYADQRLILEKGRDFDRVFPMDKAGLGLELNAERHPVVRYVSPGTPADKAGFADGDVILAINGISVSYLDGLVAVRKMFREPVGTRYDFKIDREGQDQELTMTLKDLF